MAHVKDGNQQLQQSMAQLENDNLVLQETVDRQQVKLHAAGQVQVTHAMLCSGSDDWHYVGACQCLSSAQHITY